MSLRTSAPRTSAMLAGRETDDDRRAAERRRPFRGLFVALFAAFFVAFRAGAFLPAAFLPAAFRPAVLPAFFRAAAFFAIRPRVGVMRTQMLAREPWNHG